MIICYQDFRSGALGQYEMVDATKIAQFVMPMFSRLAKADDRGLSEAGGRRSREDADRRLKDGGNFFARSRV